MIDAAQIEKNKKSYYASVKAYNVCHMDLVDKLADMGVDVKDEFLSLENQQY